jgi:hypothetical protein
VKVYINTLTPSSPALDEKTLVHAYEERSVDGKKSSCAAASHNDRLHKAVFLNYCKSTIRNTGLGILG